MAKKSKKPLLAQILALVPKHIFNDCFRRYQSDKHCSCYMTYDQFVSMMYGQLNKCLKIREIAQGISVTPEFNKDIGLEQSPAKLTMSYGNAKRDWRVFESLFVELMKYYRTFYTKRDGYQIINEIEGKTIKMLILQLSVYA